jgi:hypothetical protein
VLGKKTINCLVYPVEGRESVLVAVALEDGCGEGPKPIDLMVDVYLHKSMMSNEQVVVLKRSTFELERLVSSSEIVFDKIYTVFYSREVSFAFFLLKNIR